MERIYKKFLVFLWQYKWKFLIYLFILISWTAVSSIEPYFYKLFIDSFTSQNFDFIWQVFKYFVAISLFSVIASQLTFLTGDWLLIPVLEDIRLAIFNKIQELDFAFHIEKSTGSLISGVKRGQNAFWVLFHDSREIIRVIVEFIVIIIFLSRLKTLVFLVPTLSSLIIVGVGPFLLRKNLQARREFNKKADRLSGIITDNLINFETVKFFAKEDWEIKRLKRFFIGWKEKLWDYAWTFRYFGTTTSLISFAGVTLTIFVGINNVRQGLLSPGEFIMVVGFIRSFYGKLSNLIYRVRDLLKNKTDLERFFEILDEEIEIKDPVNPVEITKILGEIEFDNVSFSYPEGKEDALNNFNLQIKPGESIALVGESGAGKTTVTKLLLRCYDPDEGKILVDGNDIKKYRKSDLRSHIGVVPQEPILFNQTIEYNIGYGKKEDASHEEVVKAAKMALLDEFIMTLPNKYQSKVGERGIKLSGGQKQRMAIARMILSNPEIIIFDEATSQLDSESEEKIQKAFWKAAEGKTTIIIAHRLSTITRADRIIVMEDGEIIEAGTHEELAKDDKSRYYRFWQLQINN